MDDRGAVPTGRGAAVAAGTPDRCAILTMRSATSCAVAWPGGCFRRGSRPGARSSACPPARALHGRAGRPSSWPSPMPAIRGRGSAPPIPSTSRSCATSKHQNGFAVAPRRFVVERSIRLAAQVAWVNRNRWPRTPTAKDVEAIIKSAEVFLDAASLIPTPEAPFSSLIKNERTFNTP